MCGIAGIYAYHRAAPEVDHAEIDRVRDHMMARGPDGQATWLSEDRRIGLGHRRLSIIDLSDRAAQPMLSANGKLAVVFNGEIYNYEALRKDLQNKGHVFRSYSDTEVLLHLYNEKGEAMVHDLRGMFAFGLWDADKRALLLARDPYGIKPLYYADDGKTFRFASQVKALLVGGNLSREANPAGWAGFYLFGSVPEPHTTYEAIHAVSAGTTLWVDSHGPATPKHYFSVAAVYRDSEQQKLQLQNSEVQEHVRAALLDSVRHHLVSDVPVGAFLSAGVDSGALVGLMRDAGQQDIQTITLAFEEFRGLVDDESALAGQTAARYGTRHTMRVVTEQEFRSDVPKIFDAMDQPTIDGINTWFVSKAAREQGLKVAISGLGGDELFGGYSSFRDIPRWVRLLAVPSRIPLASKLFRGLINGLNRSALWISPKAAGLLDFGGSYAGAYLLRRGLFMPWELGQVMAPDMAAEGLRRLCPLDLIAAALTPRPKSSFARVAILEACIYMRNQLLRDTDWASMAHSLEVRVPLVDARLLHKLAPALTTLAMVQSKRWLAASPKVGLLRAVVERSKTGFGTPVQSWLQRDDQLHQWKRVPSIAAPGCPWARRWAYQVAAA
jgi:asparagine synthase (glutamine-hydrolysing)